jgi:hypothetical protein
VITCENHVERLIEQRFIAPVVAGDIEQLKKTVSAILQAAPSPVPICTDLRHAKVLATSVADALLKVLQGTNPKVLVSVVLLNEKDFVFSSQLDRLLTEAGNPSRKCFRALPDLLTWFKPHLSAAEMQRATHFFSTPWKMK